MHPRADGAEALAQREHLERELRRVVDRLRSLPLDRLGGPCPPWPDGVTGARSVAQHLADAAAVVEAGPAGPPRAGRQQPFQRLLRSQRLLPVLAASASADLVAVAGWDLVGALRAVPPGTRLPAADGAGVEDIVRAAVAILADLRRAVP